MISAPAYVVNADFEGYVEGWVTDDAPTLNRLLGRAEGYVDLLGSGRPIGGADAVASIAITGGVATSGAFTVSFVINNILYTSAPIAYNATAQGVLNSLQAGTGADGSTWPSGLRVQYQTRSIPLPLPSPVVFGFIGFAGSQPIAPGSIASNTIAGSGTPVPVVTQVCPGAYMGRRFNPSQFLNWGHLQPLKNAVCAQAEYMLAMGDNFFVEAQYSSVRGPDFTTVGKRGMIAPKAKRELALSGLTASMARSRA